MLLRNYLRKLFAVTMLMAATTQALAIDWNTIVTSGDYYYGVARAATRDEASQKALGELVSQISTIVSADYNRTIDHTAVGADITDVERAQMCLRTFSTSRLNNVETWVVGEEPDVEVRRYMHKSELQRIYQERIARALDLEQQADNALADRDLRYALYAYYRAYALVYTLQHPNEAVDSRGNMLINYLPRKMEQVMRDVRFAVEQRDGVYVDLLVSYQGKPVSDIMFTFNDGNSNNNQSRAKDGRGMIELVEGYEPDFFHFNIDYIIRAFDSNDEEMRPVLAAAPQLVLPTAAITLKNTAAAAATAQATPAPSRPTPQPQQPTTPAPTPAELASASASAGIHLAPNPAQLAADSEACDKVMQQILDALRSRRYSSVTHLFEGKGLSAYRDLVCYGSGRVVGTPELHYFRSTRGTTVVRGLQMSFSFKSGSKTNFVEDVVFTFNADHRVTDVCFGLGQVAENDILCRSGSAWTAEARELIMEFMEHYKTAYCMKDIDYIRNIFADDARIIVGNVSQRPTAADPDGLTISLAGQEHIRYYHYNKEQYLAQLQRCFRGNDFVNIGFSHNEVQFLPKYTDRECFAINIAQEYNSSRYGDKGYLFLFVDMTDHDAPLIKVRAWQPHETPLDKLLGAGDFFE